MLTGNAVGIHHDLMPAPADRMVTDGRLAVTGEFTVGLTGHVDARLARAVARFIGRMFDATGIPMRRGVMPAGAAATLTIQCAGPGEAVQSVREDESYSLIVDGAKAELHAPTPVGALRGLETFLQLVQLDGDGFFVPGVRIADGPRFAWRGLLLDVVRHWLPMDAVKRTLDGMAAVKLNVLHLHLSDDQGFRVECRRFSKLHELGADGEFFTQDDIRELIAYARDRGIRIMPEFDMPGHATAWFVGYPELASAPGPYEIERRTGISDPSFDPTREEVYAFIDAFVEEMAGLFPDECYHFGGDEVKPERWEQSASIQTFMREHGFATIPDLQAHFSARVAAIVERHGKTVVGWDEVLHGHLPRGVIVQAWQKYEPLVDAVRDGYRAILSHGWYLDQCLHADYHYGVDPLGGPGSAQLGEAERARVLGGEACLWGEWVNKENLDIRLWPRLAAVAERLWSPADVVDVEDMYRRLDIMSRRLHDMGMEHLRNHERMLRRLCCGANPHNLRLLADVVEPIKVYQRHKWKAYGADVALNRLVDAVRPESDAARYFAKQVDDVLVSGRFDGPSASLLTERFVTLRGGVPLLRQMALRSSLLTEVLPMIDALDATLEAGQDALEALNHRIYPEPGWWKRHLTALSKAAEPQAELLLVIVEPVRRLVEAAAQMR